MARHARNDLLSSLDEVKATARIRGEEVRSQRPSQQVPSSERRADEQAAYPAQRVARPESSAVERMARQVDGPSEARRIAQQAPYPESRTAQQAPYPDSRTAQQAPPPVRRSAQQADNASATHRTSRRGNGTSATGPVRPAQRATAAPRARRAIIPILLVLVVVVAFLAVVFVVRGSGTGDDDSLETPLAYISPYNWQNIVRENGRWSYVVNGQVKSRLGIDVSENQGHIDWQQVAADGIDFAMIRIGYRGTTLGEMYLDAEYWDNLQNAKAAGLDCGLYFFSQATNEAEAREEAEFVLTNLNGAPLEYPIVFDSEEVAAGIGKSRTSGLSKDEMAAIEEAFCKRIEQAGYETMIYGNAHDLSRYRRAVIEKRQLWWAEYGSPNPLAKIDIVMWQYSNEGHVAGIATNVDMNMDLRGALN